MNDDELVTPDFSWYGATPEPPRPPISIPKRLPPRRPRFNSRRPESTLSSYRLLKAMTQQELAEAAGVSRNTIVAIEAGRCAPSVYTALAIADALDFSVETLFKLRPARTPKLLLPKGWIAPDGGGLRRR